MLQVLCLHRAFTREPLADVSSVDERGALSRFQTPTMLSPLGAVNRAKCCLGDRRRNMHAVGLFYQDGLHRLSARLELPHGYFYLAPG